MKIAIIGAGFCGLAVAWNLLNHSTSVSNLKVHLFDAKGIGKGASGIAAGLLHPFAGAHAKLNWRGREGFEATQDLLNAASTALRQPVTAKDQGILRLALNSEQETDFQLCAEKYAQETEWLDATSCQALAPGTPLVPGLWIKEGLTIYSSLYLKGLWQVCQQLGAQFEQRAIKSIKDLQGFDLIIVTTGAEILHMDEFSSLPLKLVKGQVLELAWPADLKPLACALNSHVYITMTEHRTSCLVGSTYEKGYQEALVDLEHAKKEILPKALELFPPLKKSSVINCYAGMRAFTSNYHPLMQRISSSLWILTGMGSKGLLYHALYGRELVEKIFDVA